MNVFSTRIKSSIEAIKANIDLIKQNLENEDSPLKGIVNMQESPMTDLVEMFSSEGVGKGEKEAALAVDHMEGKLIKLFRQNNDVLVQVRMSTQSNQKLDYIAMSRQIENTINTIKQHIDQMSGICASWGRLGDILAHIHDPYAMAEYIQNSDIPGIRSTLGEIEETKEILEEILETSKLVDELMTEVKNSLDSKSTHIEGNAPQSASFKAKYDLTVSRDVNDDEDTKNNSPTGP